MKGKNKGQALYRRYRPQSLDQIVGQPQVREVLSRSLKQGRVAHAYLLTGPRGVGKTSIARILAHEINKLPYTDDSNHLDIIEIDAASNNGVDDVRDLRDKVQLAPISADKKIYIIDEVHMLSKPAFNALLKTLEEPPEHIVFILATTDLHKVPATIISRTQHFAFHSISSADLVSQLKNIAKEEGMKVTDDALAAIAEKGDGSFRDSISLLDQLSSFAESDEGITLELVESTLGLAKSAAVKTLLDAVTAKDVAGVIAQLTKLEQSGIQPVILASQLIQTVRSQLADNPAQVTLLDELLGVASSPQPQLKLLTVLVAAAKPKQAAAATVTAKPKVILEAPVVIVDKPAPIAKTVAKPAPKPVEKIETAPKVLEPPKPAPVKRTTSGPVELDWEVLIEETRTNYVALHSVLSKCTHKLDGDTLTLYTARKFNKTKLDDPKYLTKLHEALAVQGVEGLEIVTIPETAPPEDEQLAKIAAMMGGGQEISLEEVQEPA